MTNKLTSILFFFCFYFSYGTVVFKEKETFCCQGSNIQNLSDKRGRLSEYTSPKHFEFNTNEVINVLDFGAIGDGKKDNSKAFKQAAALDKILYVPSGEFKVNETISLTNGIYGQGTIVSSNKVCFNVESSNVFFEGITIESSLREGKTVPFAIYIKNYDHIKITNCNFLNNRVIDLNDENKYHTDLIIENNCFVSDYSPFPVKDVQNDVITIRGIDSIRIKSNYFEFLNPNRVLKISDNSGSPYKSKGLGAKVSSFNSKNIYIENNIFVGRTNSGKQVVDLFKGTQNVYISNNEVDVSGFSSVIENKTGLETDFAQNMQIFNNIFKNNSLILSFQGSYGALTPKHNSGIQNITITNNSLIGKTPFLYTKRGVVEIRFYHLVEFASNDLIFDNEVGGFSASFFSNRDLNFSNNTIRDGTVKVSLTRSNHSSEKYDAKVMDIQVACNSFIQKNENFDRSSLFISSVGTQSSNLSITSNSFENTATFSKAKIRIEKTTFNVVTITKNVFLPSNGRMVKPITNQSNMLNNFIENANSWNNEDFDKDGFISPFDCDDSNKYINPSANEIPNNLIDENCDCMI